MYHARDFASNRCPLCVGTGKMLGGGMIFKACKNCSGAGKVDGYQRALNNIKALDEKLTDEQAKNLLHEEIEKLETGDKSHVKKRGRRKKS